MKATCMSYAMATSVQPVLRKTLQKLNCFKCCGCLCLTPENGYKYFHTEGIQSNELKATASKPYKGEDILAGFSYRQFLDHFYDLLREGQDKARVSRLLRGIKNSGLWKNDPRLAETMKKIADFHLNSGDGVDILLDKEGLKDCIQDNIVMIRKAFVGDLVIPEFPKFCNMIDEIYWACRSNMGGRVSTYIPQLASYSPDYWGISLCTVDGQRHAIGDVEVPFTLQSSGKPINYALAVHELGAEVVHQYIGHEPNGETYSSIKLNKEGKPHNPMNNDGALIVTSLLYSNMSLAERFDSVMSQYKRLSGGEYISFNNSTFLSEKEVADRNYALGYYLRENKCFPDGINLNDTMDLYFQLCSLEVTGNSGAVIAACLANGGYCPLTEEQILTSTAVRNTLSLMHSCGMYDYSGGFAFTVGLPGKAGISGGILLVVPNVLGMCLWSPRLDEKGNSVRGLQFCKQLVRNFNFHHYSCLQRPGVELDPRVKHTDMQSNLIVKLLFSACNGDLTGLIKMAMANTDMTLADYDGRTALHLAASEGHLECVKFLVEKCGVPLDAKDRWGQKPVDDAVRFGHEAVAVYLENASKT